MISAAELLERFPSIPWREPVQVQNMGGPTGRYFCRICIAQVGLKASEIEFKAGSKRDVLAHIKTVHPEVAQ